MAAPCASVTRPERVAPRSCARATARHASASAQANRVVRTQANEAVRTFDSLLISKFLPRRTGASAAPEERKRTDVEGGDGATARGTLKPTKPSVFRAEDRGLCRMESA